MQGKCPHRRHIHRSITKTSEPGACNSKQQQGSQNDTKGNHIMPYLICAAASMQNSQTRNLAEHHLFVLYQMPHPNVNMHDQNQCRPSSHMRHPIIQRPWITENGIHGNVLSSTNSSLCFSYDGKPQSFTLTGNKNALQSIMFYIIDKQR